MLSNLIDSYDDKKNLNILQCTVVLIGYILVFIAYYIISWLIILICKYIIIISIIFLFLNYYKSIN